MEIKKINLIKNEFDNIEIKEIQNLINLYKGDERIGVQKIIEKAKKRKANYEKELNRLNEMVKFENIAYSKGLNRVAGFDEVGRGPLAGPVVTAGVILPKDLLIFGINDSKKLSEEKREKLFNEIQEKALEITINMEDNIVIDELNILEATKLSMQKNLQKFRQAPDYLIIDAITLNTNIETLSIIKADLLSQSVAAASIIAKVTRDNYMKEMHKIYPQYNFNQNKGYGTKEHIEALLKYGACPIHRKSFIKNFGI